MPYIRVMATTFVNTEQLPVAATKTLPGRYFSSPQILAEEFDKIFTQRWLCVGRADRIAGPGDYFLQPIGHESIIVVRDRAGEIHAHYNVCRHRGTHMIEAETGRLGETIQCPYHAWTYALDGRLIGCPSADAIDGFKKSDYPLHAVATHVWEGFLFINLSRHPEPFEDAYAPMLGRFSSFNLPNLKVAGQIDYDVRANWKLIVENYQECYHCAPIHPSLSKLTPPTSGEIDLYEGPFIGGYMVLNEEHETMSMTGRACGVPVADDLPAAEYPRIYYYSLFPNALLSVHHDYVMLHTLWPLAVDRTRIHCYWLFNDKSLNNPKCDPTDGIKFWDMTNKEDWHICEQSQLGVVSRVYTPGPYSKRENCSAAFDAEVLRSLGHAPER
jgi:phenylpropionate dioxygenase-like ring-hydroxylating dioxygenase large terminal subunit